ncbi:MAG: hypothetical protein ACYS47_06245 [Planctomycetota bacterium]
MRRAFPLVLGLAVAVGVLLLLLLLPSGEEILYIPGVGEGGGPERPAIPGTGVPRSGSGKGTSAGSGVPETGLPGHRKEGPKRSGKANAILFAGRVLEDGSERPIPGARVLAWGGSIDFPPSVSLGQRPLGSAVTDENGGFLLTGIPGSESFLVSVEAEGFEHVRSLEYEEKDRSDRAFHLRKGCRLRGTVIDVHGKPVAGAPVFALPYDEADILSFGDPMQAVGQAPLTSLRTFASASTDEKGRYSIDSIEPGGIDACLWAVAEGPGGGRGVAEAAEDLENPGGFMADVRLLGDSTLALRARSVGGAPLYSGQVHVFTPEGELLLNQLGTPRGGETGEDGRCTIRSLPAGTFIVHLWPHGCRPVVREIRLRPGETTRLDIELAPGLILELVVIDAGGDSIPGADVSVRPKGGANIAWGADTLSGGRFEAAERTNDQGEVRLTGMPVGLLRITVEHEEYSNRRLVGRAGGRRPLRVVLAPHPCITGVVRWPGRWRPRKIRINPVRGASYGTALSPLSATGLFRFTWKGGTEEMKGDPGLFLYIEVPGWPSIRRGPFHPEPGERIDLGDLTEPKCRDITGTVRNPQGEPVRGAEVEFTVPWYPFAIRDSTDEKGAFSLNDVPFWEGWLTAQHRDYPPEPHWIGEGETGPLDFQLVETAVVKGRVVNRAGSGSGSCTLWIRPEGKFADQDPRAAQVESDSQGFFEFSNLRSGTYKIFLRPQSVAKSEWAWDRELPGPAVQIESGEKRTVEIVIDE